MRPALPLLAALLLTACIPKQRYEEDLGARDAIVAGLEGQVVTLRGERDTLAADLTEVRAEMVAQKQELEARIAQAGELAQEIDQVREALAAAEARQVRVDAALASYEDLVRRFQRLIDAGTLQVKVLDGRMVVELATDILFPPGSASLSREGSVAVRQVATVLAAIPDRTFEVSGHTDDRPIATERFPSNWHLGASRAIAVVQLLVANDLPPARISAASHAETRPVAPNRTPEGRAANRRIEIVVVPDLSELPGYAELEAIAHRAEAPQESP